MNRPKVTYIVGAFDRPASLPCCLWSLKVQTDPDFEVIVADNSHTLDLQEEHRKIVDSMRDVRFSHRNTAFYPVPGWDCYWSAEWIVKNGHARGDWLCLPNDDSYYVPIFQEAMLEAATKRGWKFVYSDMLYDRRIGGRYQKLDVAPWRGAIDKTGFLIHRDVWIGFPNKASEKVASTCDGEMANELVEQRKVRHGKVPEILVVLN